MADGDRRYAIKDEALELLLTDDREARNRLWANLSTTREEAEARQLKTVTEIRQVNMEQALALLYAPDKTAKDKIWATIPEPLIELDDPVPQPILPISAAGQSSATPEIR